MALGSAIEWTEATWNPVTGCTKISPGCKHCYAERMAGGFRRWATELRATDSSSRCSPRCWSCRCRWRKPRTIFVNSMSDLFHEDVPLEYIQRVFDVMSRAHWHTSRCSPSAPSDRASCSAAICVAANIWMGVSVENADVLDRIDHLRQTPARRSSSSRSNRCSGPADSNLTGIDWVIVGGESGRARGRWTRSGSTEIRDQCVEAGVAVLLQAVGRREQEEGRPHPRGRTWDEMPDTAPTVPVARVSRVPGRSLAVVG